MKCEGCSGLDQKIGNSIDELLMKAVINGWPALLQFLLPFAQEEGVDFNAPLPTIEQEPFNKRPLLHNLVCTPHCDLDILKILLFEVQVDVNQKDLNGCRAVELAVSRIPNNHEYDKPVESPMHAVHLKAIPWLLMRRDFDIASFNNYDDHSHTMNWTGPRGALDGPLDVHEEKGFWRANCRICLDVMVDINSAAGDFEEIVDDFNDLPFHEMYEWGYEWDFEQRTSAYWIGRARDIHRHYHCRY